MRAAALRAGIEMPPHVAHAVTREDYDWADIVIAADLEVAKAIQGSLSDSQLMVAGETGIDDPYGGTTDDFDRATARIQAVAADFKAP
jgi:protein-tyrosine-phosphatase